MDERYLYLFVRQDLPIAQQIVQANHATFAIAIHYGFGIPNIILIGVPDLAALHRVERKLKGCAIPHFCWSEPDYDFGFTAIATAPLRAEERGPLLNYRLWKFAGGAGQTGLRGRS